MFYWVECLDKTPFVPGGIARVVAPEFRRLPAFARLGTTFVVIITQLVYTTWTRESEELVPCTLRSAPRAGGAYRSFVSVVGLWVRVVKRAPPLGAAQGHIPPQQIGSSCQTGLEKELMFFLTGIAGSALDICACGWQAEI